MPSFFSIRLIWIVFFHGHLSAQNIFIDEICACEENSEIRSFTITFGQWPAHIDSSYNVNITYTKEGGGRDTMSAENVAGDPNRRMTLVFSGLSNAANPGDLQIFRVVNASSNLPQPVSAAFIPYLPAPDVEVIPPADTTISTCQLSGLSIEEAFDAWLSGAASANGCGDIELTNDWDGIYPSCQDSLSISFTATDQNCANLASSSSSFSIEDCQPPTPVVINGVVSAQVSANDCVEVHINEFDAGSFDNCGPVQLSFSDDVNDTIATFCCEDGLGTKEVEVWATDAVGNQDFVITSIRIQDPNEVCGDPSLPSISGNVESNAHNGEGIERVEMRLDDMSAPTPAFRQTQADGGFVFQANVGKSYTLAARKNDDPLNGVNTYDILLMQRHILGLDPIGNPYTLIAANINDDERISGADIVELRRVILGVEPNFPNNESWRFVDASEQLVEGLLPRNYVEQLSIIDVTEDVTDQDFVGVKIGDIDGSAVPNDLMADEAEGRSGALVFAAQNAALEAGQVYEMPISSDMFTDVYGYQLTWNLSGVTVEGIESGAVNIGTSNYANFDAHMTMSWHDVNGLDVDADEVLFTIRLRATADVRLSDAIELTSAITSKEAYVGASTRSVDLRFESSTAKEFALYQNTPNPFESTTLIRFDLPEANEATLTIFDGAGKVIHDISGDFNAGMNQVEVRRSDLNGSGLMYYRLESGEYSAVKKMILME
jgi:hypothetical protein